MISPHKDLRSGHSVWESYRHPTLRHSSLLRDVRVDVTIIGAGISGALMAERMTADGFTVAIVDRRGALKGSTLATTALLQYELDMPLTKLTRKIGFDDAARAWRRTQLAVASLADRTRLLGISCGLSESLTLYLAGDMLNAGQLADESALRRSIGLENRLLSAKDTAAHGLCGRAAIESCGSYIANPCQMAAGYLAAALERGARLYAPTDIKDVHTDGRHAYVETKDGPVIRAGHVVFCTGYEVPKQLQKQDFKILSTWAIATDRGDVRPGMPMAWESSDPYLYLRPTKDGRVICGGEDEKFSDEDARNALTEKKAGVLMKKLRRMIPGLGTARAEYNWCGSFGVTPTSLPLIGAVPRMKNACAVLAFGGNGIANSRIGADIVSGIFAGREDPDAALFRFRG